MARAVLVVDDHAPPGRWPEPCCSMEAVGQLRPNVAVHDIQLLDLDGLEVARWRARAEDPPVIRLVSNRDGFARMRRLAESPACGLIPKNGLSDAAVAALVG